MMYIKFRFNIKSLLIDAKLPKNPIYTRFVPTLAYFVYSDLEAGARDATRAAASSSYWALILQE